MAQHDIEKLSAMVDGELDSQQSFLDDIQGSQELQQRWQRYHLVKSTLRKELPPQIDLNISQAVADALAEEPTILRPTKSRWESVPVLGNVIPLVRHSGQLAIAASVALAVVVGVQQWNQPAEVQQGSDLIPFNLPAQGGLSPVSLEETTTTPTVSRQQMVEQQRRMSALLNDHHQQMRLKQALSSAQSVQQEQESEEAAVEQQ